MKKNISTTFLVPVLFIFLLSTLPGCGPIIAVGIGMTGAGATVATVAGKQQATSTAPVKNEVFLKNAEKEVAQIKTFNLVINSHKAFEGELSSELPMKLMVSGYSLNSEKYDAQLEITATPVKKTINNLFSSRGIGKLVIKITKEGKILKMTTINYDGVGKGVYDAVNDIIISLLI